MLNNKTISAVSDKQTERKLADRAIIVIIGNLIGTVGKIILPIILVRLIAKADYGSFRQAMMLYATFGTIFLFGIPNSIYYFIPQLSDREIKKLTAQSFILLFFLGLILTIFFYFLSGSIAKWFNNEALNLYIKIFSLYFLFMLPAQALIPLLISINKHRNAAITSIAFMLVLICSVLLPLFLGCGLEGVFISLVIFAFLQFLIVIFYLIKIFRGLTWEWDADFIKRQLAFALPVGLSGVVGIISRFLDKYIISLVFTPARFAIYEIGARELPLVNILPYTMSNVLQPKLVEYYHKGNLTSFINLWHTAINKISLIMLPIFVFTFIIAKDLIVFLYTTHYVESVSIFRIYLCILPLRVTAFGPVLLATGRPRFVFWITCIGLGLNLGLSVILLYFVGFIGPAIATIITQCFAIILYLKKISSVVKLRFQEVFPFKHFSKVLVVSGLCGFLVSPLTLLKCMPVLIILIGALCYTIVYVVLLKALNLLKAEDIALLKKWLTLGFMKMKFVH